jgi:hypothetical protein
MWGQSLGHLLGMPGQMEMVSGHSGDREGLGRLFPNYPQEVWVQAPVFQE